MYDRYKNWKCDKYVITGGKCGRQTVIRSLNPASASTIYSRLFIGCENWKPRSKGHTFVSLTGYDPIAILQIWGSTHCQVHDDIKEEMKSNWNDEGNGKSK